jgi:hypothetical protein
MSRHHSSSTRSRVATIVIGAALLIPVHPTIAAGESWVYDQSERSPLQGAHTTVIEGRRVKGGCEYPAETETVELDPGESWEVRDIAVDMANCRKIRESGTPTEIVGPDVTDASISEALATRRSPREPLATNDASAGSAMATAATGFRYVVHRTWWSDAAGITLNYDETRSSWIWNVGGCVIDGNSSGDWGWFAASGWTIVSYSGYANRTCARYFAHTESHFRNTAFCGGVSVDTYYYKVDNFGYNTGGFAGSRSSDTLRECLPVFMYYQIVG